MFKFVLGFLLISSAHATMVISDVDDTLKITNSGSATDATWNGFFEKHVFPGMPELYKAWSSEKTTIHFVTGSPGIVRKNIIAMLKNNKITYATLITRPNLLESTYKFKMRAISRLMEASPLEQVVLIGDDVSHDHLVFRDLNEKFPGRVLASYIRPVKNRAGLEGQIPYVTAYDVVTNEVAEGRMGLLDYGVVMAAVLTGSKTRLFPKFTWCPTELDGTTLPTESSTYLGAQQVEDHIESICRGRRSDSKKDN